MDASLVFDIDSMPARTAATDLIKLGDAAVKASRGFTRIDGPLRAANGQFRSAVSVIEDYGNEVSDLSKEFNTFASATLKAQQYEIRLNRAIELGVASKAEAAAELRRYQQALRSSNPLVREMEKAERDAAKAAKIASDRREAARREFIPLYAASKQYEAALNRLNAAEKAGDLNATQHAAALAELNARYQQSANAAQRFGQSQEIARHHVANLSFQLNDIGMMMATGQSPFMLMMQQGPQVAQILSQLQQEGRSLGATLAGAFRMVLNPTMLFTLALVGGAAAFVQWARGGRDATSANDGFATSLSDLASAANSYATALRTADQNSYALTAQFGAQADNLRRLYDLNVQLEQIKLGQSIREAGEQANAAYGGLEKTLKDINDLIDYGARNEQVRENALNSARLLMADLKHETGLTLGQAQAMSDTIVAMSSAQTMEEQARATEDFAAQLLAAHRAGATIPPELIDIAAKAGVAASAIREMASASRDAAAAWSEVGTNTGMFVTRYTPPPMDRPKPPPPPGGGGGSSGGGQSAEDILREEMKRRWESLNEGFQSEYQLSMQHYQRDLETLKWALDQKTITQQEYEANRMMLYTTAWGAEWQQTQLQRQMDIEALQAAFDQKLILEEEYYRKRRELFWNDILSDENRSAMAQDLSDTARYFGQLTALTGNSYDGLLRIQKSFQAASALMNAWKGYTDALATGGLSPWAKLAWAGKILSAGLGAVSAIRGGGKSGGGSSAATTTQQAQREPTRYVTINWDGPDWMRDGINGLLDEIYDQSKDGRVIIAQERR